jgi:hypothetical protein
MIVPYKIGYPVTGTTNKQYVITLTPHVPTINDQQRTFIACRCLEIMNVGSTGYSMRTRMIG